MMHPFIFIEVAKEIELVIITKEIIKGIHLLK